MSKYCFFLMLFIVGPVSNSFSQNNNIDSLLTLLKNDTQDSSKTIHLIEICKAYDFAGDYGKSLSYGKQAIEITKQLNDKSRLAEAYNCVGLVYKDYGNFPKAIENYFLALKENELAGDKKGVATICNNLAGLYYVQKKFKEALNWSSKSLKIKKEINDKKGIASSYNNIGVINDDLGNYDEALGNCFVALKINKEMNNVNWIGNNYNNIGNIYEHQKNYTEALKMYYASLAIKKEIGNKDGMLSSFINLANTHFKLHKTKVAKEYLDKALDLGIEIGSKDAIRDSYELIARIDSALGDYKASFAHYKLFIIYRDSLNNEESNQKIMQSAMQYEFDKKEAATKFESDKIINKLEADNKLHTQQRVFLVIFIIIVLALLLFAKRAYDNKKKIAEFMADESHRKEILLEEIHHRINNNLQIISSLLSLQANSANDLKLKEYLSQSQTRIQSLSALHNLLYQNESSLSINMNLYLNKVLAYHRDVISTMSKSVDIVLNVPDVEFSTKLAVPIALIVNELVTNCLKYAFSENQKGEIKIALLSLSQELNSWQLIVKDNGKGLPEETAFRADSLGLRLVGIMTKQLKGTFSKRNDEGAEFEISFVSLT